MTAACSVFLVFFPSESYLFSRWLSVPVAEPCLPPNPGFVPTASQNSRWFMMSPKSELSLTLPLRERTALLATQRCILLARVSRSRAESRQPENRPPGSAQGEGSTGSRIPEGLQLWPVPRASESGQSADREHRPPSSLLRREHSRSNSASEPGTSCP